LERIRAEIAERSAIREKVSTSIDLPLSNECKRILAYANEESEQLNSRYIGTEHLLLGILREEKCLAREILSTRGLRLETIREELARRGPSPDERPGFLSLSSPRAVNLNSEVLLAALEKHRFTTSHQHLLRAVTASEEQDWKTAQMELQLFLEAMVDAIKERLNGDDAAFPIFEGFDWRLSLRELRSGLAADEDWKFRWWLTVLLADVLMKRFEQRLNS
jgi:hypothetical protein